MLRGGIVMTAALVMTAIVLAAPSAFADDGIDNDQGTVSHYTYTFNFAFEGTDAQSILWDFGFDNPDGSRATSPEWNPRGIVFPAKGEYVITQTVTNTVGSYTSRVVLKVLGTPEVSFETGGGSHAPMQVVKAGTYAERPDDPVRDGYDFDGWYTDPGCGRPFDFGTQVTGHMALYAKWVPSSGDGGDAGDGGSDGPDGAGSGYAALFSGSMVGIGIVGLAVNSRRMHPNGAVFIPEAVFRTMSQTGNNVVYHTVGGSPLYVARGMDMSEGRIDYGWIHELDALQVMTRESAWLRWDETLNSVLEENLELMSHPHIIGLGHARRSLRSHLDGLGALMGFTEPDYSKHTEAEDDGQGD